MDKKKLVIVAWKKCSSKTLEGGLGIIFLKHYNTTSNTYLHWQFLNQNQSWSKLLAARVKRNGKLIKYSIKSSLWKGFKDVFDFVMENCIWVIGNGKTVNFWMNNWAGEILSFKFKILEKFHSGLNKCITDYWQDHSWTLHDNITIALRFLVPFISSYSISDLNFDDLLAWKIVEGGILSIKHCLEDFPSHRVAPSSTRFLNLQIICSLVANMQRTFRGGIVGNFNYLT